MGTGGLAGESVRDLDTDMLVRAVKRLSSNFLTENGIWRNTENTFNQGFADGSTPLTG